MDNIPPRFHPPGASSRTPDSRSVHCMRPRSTCSRCTSSYRSESDTALQPRADGPESMAWTRVQFRAESAVAATAWTQRATRSPSMEAPSSSNSFCKHVSRLCHKSSFARLTMKRSSVEVPAKCTTKVRSWVNLGNDSAGSKRWDADWVPDSPGKPVCLAGKLLRVYHDSPSLQILLAIDCFYRADLGGSSAVSCGIVGFPQPNSNS